MTIKYNVSGAKTRNGKEIAPMAFGDCAEAERFAKYHEGLSVPQNFRKHPGNITVVGTFSAEGQPQNIPKYGAGLKNHLVSAECVALHLQQVGRSERKSPPVTFVIDPKVFMAGIQEHTGPAQILKLPIVLGGVRPLKQPATVGNPNADLEEAYAMGFRAARSIDPDDFHETQDYVDQRRSDLKELVSYDRSV